MTILQHAKSLRQNMTEAEQKLWYYLRGNRFSTVRFKRQKVIGPYIVDFVAVQAKLIVEIDGSQHIDQQKYDQHRTDFLENLGFRVLRFWNNECLTQTDDVLKRIHNVLNI